MPTPFAEILPYAKFREIVAALGADGNEPYDKALRAVAQPALRRLLEERHAAGALRPVPDSDGHDGTFLRAWNGFVTGVVPDGDPVPCLDRVVRFLAHDVVGRWAFFADPKADAAGDTASTEKFYGKMVGQIDAGDISHFSLPSEKCWITDETYRIQFEGWNPSFVQWDPKAGVTPMRAGSPASVKSFEVDFPTGELLVADWFRLPGFNEAIERLWDGARRPSLNSEAGQEEATRRYAEAGLVHVGVDNSSPKAFDRDGVIVFGRGEGEGLAQVCTDMWAVSVIDRARLVELLAAGAGAAEARREVDAYVEEGAAEVIRVEPGTHTIYMTGEKDRFPGLFTCREVDLDGIEPFFVLSPRPLSLDADAEPASGPRP